MPIIVDLFLELVGILFWGRGAVPRMFISYKLDCFYFLFLQSAAFLSSMNRKRFLYCLFLSLSVYKHRQHCSCWLPGYGAYTSAWSLVNYLLIENGKHIITRSIWYLNNLPVKDKQSD